MTVTGMGGFLQGVIFGYLGLRTRLDRMDFDPKLPPGCSGVTATGINYHAAVLNIRVEEDTVTVAVDDAGEGLEIVQEETGSLLVDQAEEIVLPRQKFSIIPLNVDYLDRCPLPLDKIGGYGTHI